MGSSTAKIAQPSECGLDRAQTTLSAGVNAKPRRRAAEGRRRFGVTGPWFGPDEDGARGVHGQAQRIEIVAELAPIERHRHWRAAPRSWRKRRNRRGHAVIA